MGWKVAVAHNNEAGLADMVQQPAAASGIVYPELRFGADGTAAFHGAAYCDLEWNVIKRDTRNALLRQFGLWDTVASAPVTVRIRNNPNVFVAYNATAVFLNGGTRAVGRWERLTIRLNRLEPIAIVITPAPAYVAATTVDPEVIIAGGE